MAGIGTDFMAESTATKPAIVKRTPGQPPALPDTTEKWSFRDVKGSREKIRAAINDARLTDPKTRKPGEQSLPDPVKNYLLWVLDSLEGDVFILDYHVHAASKLDFYEHLHLKTFC